MMKLGQMFSKERTLDMNGRSSVWDGSLLGGHVQTNGFAAGTQVATNLGWRDVKTLQKGDMVLTFDDGLQKITHIDRRRSNGTSCAVLAFVRSERRAWKQF